MYHLEVGPLPRWMDSDRLVVPGLKRSEIGGWVHLSGEVDRRTAADVIARLRNQTIAGRSVQVSASPRVPRPAVRGARTEDARRRRDTTPGFTKKGVKLDEIGKYSLTPEVLATRLGNRFAHKTVADVCCGAGGNAIGFARGGCRVVAVDIDRERLAMAEHNARIYGVHDRIRFILGDASMLPLGEVDAVFVDPPWSDPDLAPLRSFVDRRDQWPTLLAKVPAPSDPTQWQNPVCEAWFGEADGDRQRVKFVLFTWLSRSAQ